MRATRSNWSRREILAGALGTALASAWPARRLRADESIRFASDPFRLGVASGYPTPDSCVLWTRIAPRPEEPGGGVPAAVVPVAWELALDERFERIARQGVAYATPDWAHSVHVEPAGLEPARPYWYRFIAGGQRSPTGRVITAPARRADVRRMRLAIASCQQYEHGYYAAYRHMLDDELDLVVHVGDYIYELTWGRDLVRSHGSPECYSLEDYRARHALYRSDADLQAAHAAYPWLVTWDDHEVDNDYADDTSEENDDPELFLARRACAYRAYYEHLPLPSRMTPFGPRLRLYTERRFGSLVNCLLLDERQYRSPQACPKLGKRGSNRVTDCPELQNPSRTKLGTRQEEWLAASLADSDAQWHLLAQGTVMAYVDELAGDGERFWTDGWNGYPAARSRFLSSVESSGARNPVVLSGDIHAFGVANLNRTPGDPESAIVASEFTTTSITSQPVSQKSLDERRSESPSLLWLDGSRRGYLRFDVTRERLQADLVALDDATRPDSKRSVQAVYVVEAGRAGPQRG
jgi:alkaline phosphatase D